MRVLRVARRDAESVLEEDAIVVEVWGAVPNLLAIVRLTSSRAIESFSGDGGGGGVKLTPLALRLLFVLASVPAFAFCAVSVDAPLLRLELGSASSTTVM